MKRKLLFIAAITSLTQTLFSQSLNFSGKLETNYAAGIFNSNAGKCIQGGFESEAKLEAFYNESSFNLLAAMEYNPVNAKNDEDFSFKIKEAYYDYNGSFWALRAGRQINAWGAADGFILCDVLCPQDITALLADDTKESRLGIDALRLSLISENINFDTYVIPFFTPAKLPEEIKKSIEIEKTETKISNFEYGGKLAFYLKKLDFSLYTFYGFQDEPLIALQTSEPYLKGQYKKYYMLGFDSSIPAGDLTIRTESAVFPEKYFSRNDYASYEKHTEIKTLAGLDWFKDNWQITGQYYADFISSSVKNLDEKAFSHSASLQIAYNIERLNLDLSATGLINFNDFDSYLSGEIKYDWTDAINLSLQGKFFLKGYENEGTYGKYHDFSCIVLKGSYNF